MFLAGDAKGDAGDTTAAQNGAKQDQAKSGGDKAADREATGASDDSLDDADLRDKVAELLRQLATLMLKMEMADVVNRQLDRNENRGEEGAEREPMRPINPLGNVRLPRDGWLQSPFQDLSYVGKSDRQNPVWFLRRFKSIANYEEMNERDQLHYFARCMKNQAGVWFELRDFNDIRQAKRAFKEQFWGQEVQAQFREHLYTGKYAPTEKPYMTMSEYAMSLARDARLLEPTMSEYEVIRCVKRHFDRDVTREVRPSTVKSLQVLMGLLEDIEANKSKGKEGNGESEVARKTGGQDHSSRRPANAAKPWRPSGHERTARPTENMGWQPRALEYRQEETPSQRRDWIRKPTIEFPNSEDERTERPNKWPGASLRIKRENMVLEEKPGKR